jgi:hypothetical protein
VDRGVGAELGRRRQRRSSGPSVRAEGAEHGGSGSGVRCSGDGRAGRLPT